MHYILHKYGYFTTTINDVLLIIQTLINKRIKVKYIQYVIVRLKRVVLSYLPTKKNKNNRPILNK